MSDFNETEQNGVETVDAGRRAAMLKLGKIAGAAPAVALLLTPSASRAEFRGGSSFDGDGGDPDSKPGRHM